MNINAAGKAIGLVFNMLDATKPTAAPVAFKPQKPEFKPSGERFFTRVSPEECGVGSEAVCDYVRALAADESVGLQTVMLLRGDRVFFEAAADDDSLSLHKSTFSECKSIVSLAIGKLYTDGLLDLDEKLADIFPQKTGAMSLMRLKNVTVRHLLNMTAAVEFNELEAIVSTDWVKGFMRSSFVGEPGKTFFYNSLNTYMLAAAVKEKTGKTLTEYLDETIFGELGITDYYWETCPMGNAKGGWGLYILPEDAAKLGVFVLNGGVWNGKRIISEEYIEKATSAQAIAPKKCGDYNYGYQFWCGRTVNSFLMNGMLGQNLLCFRDNGIIIVSNCSNGDNFQQNAFFRITAKHFNKSFPASLPFNGESERRINCLKRELREGFPREKLWRAETKAPEYAECLRLLAGKRFRADGASAASAGFEPLFMQMVQNNYVKGLKEIDFEDRNGVLYVVFRESEDVHEIPVPENGAGSATVRFGGEPFLVTARGRFSETEDGIPVFTLKCAFPETPYKRVYKFHFGAETRLLMTETPGVSYAKVVPQLMRTMAEYNHIAGSVLSKIADEHITALTEYAFEPKVILKEMND